MTITLNKNWQSSKNVYFSYTIIYKTNNYRREYAGTHLPVLPSNKFYKILRNMQDPWYIDIAGNKKAEVSQVGGEVYPLLWYFFG